MQDEGGGAFRPGSAAGRRAVGARRARPAIIANFPPPARNGAEDPTDKTGRAKKRRRQPMALKTWLQKPQLP